MVRHHRGARLALVVTASRPKVVAERPLSGALNFLGWRLRYSNASLFLSSDDEGFAQAGQDRRSVGGR